MPESPMHLRFIADPARNGRKGGPIFVPVTSPTSKFVIWVSWGLGAMSTVEQVRSSSEGWHFVENPGTWRPEGWHFVENPGTWRPCRADLMLLKANVDILI